MDHSDYTRGPVESKDDHSVDPSDSADAWVGITASTIDSPSLPIVIELLRGPLAHTDHHQVPEHKVKGL